MKEVIDNWKSILSWHLGKSALGHGEKEVSQVLKSGYKGT